MHNKKIGLWLGEKIMRYSEEEQKLLFVYGSLKQGFCNHNVLDKRFCKKIGDAKTVKKFGMFIDDFGNYPYLIDEPFSNIDGELYEIYTQELLDKLDEFEGTPDYYTRELIEVESCLGMCLAYVYIKHNVKIPKEQIPLVVWREYE